MSEAAEFYQAFFAGVQSGGLELRDHWHDEEDTSVTYKLPDAKTGKTMRYKVAYSDATDAQAGSRAAVSAVARFFNRSPDTTSDANT